MNLKKYMLTCFHMLAICSGLQKAYTQPVQRMIVFIHGTILPVPHPKAAFSWFKGDGYLNGLRFDGMYSHQAIGNEGLHEIEDYHHASSPYTSCSVELKRLFELQYNNFGDLEENNLNEIRKYFVFGWGGELKYQSRVDGAQALYDALVQKKNELAQSNIDVQIELWAHSHAGNVALYLAHIEKEKKENLSINHLVMFATPVHEETKDCVRSHMFNKIFHFYSLKDTIQLCDWFTTSGWVERTFDAHDLNNFYEFSLQFDHFFPSHYELAFFAGSKMRLYRKNFPSYPLPCAAFGPQFLRALENPMMAQSGTMCLSIKNNKLYYSSKDASRSGAMEFTLPQDFFSH